MTKRLTTEQMVRRCFCFDEKKGNPFTIRDYARAARRFVRLEDKQKADRLHEQFKRESRVDAKTGKLTLPKYWGEVK